MVLDCNVPNEIKASVKDALGSRKGQVIRLVQYEYKADRLDTRTLVLTDYRLLILTTKVPVKIEHNVHFTEITKIESPAHNKLIVQTENKRIYVQTVDKDEVDRLLLYLGQALHKSFPGIPIQELIPSFHLEDAKRMLHVLDQLRDSTTSPAASSHRGSRESNGASPMSAGGSSVGGGGPCGSFSEAYRCLCDYHNQPCQEDVVWDVDTIYLSQDARQLCLADFDHLDGKHLVPIIAALEYNKWFTALNVSNIKLSAEAMSEILRILKKNSTLEELYMSNIGAKYDFAQRLSQSLSSNEGAQIKVLDLSNNLIEDKGLVHLCSVPKLSRCLTSLRLSQVGMSVRAANKLAEALGHNRYMATTLTMLDLSGNVLRGEELTMLNKFLSEPNALTHLNLSGTECALDTMIAALMRGCTQHLSDLDLSGTCFSHKRPKDVTVPQAWKQFFCNSLALQRISLSECKGLPTDAIKFLLLGISSNPNPLSVCVNLSSCSLGSAGASIMEMCMADLQQISSLDISDNGLDHGLEGLMAKIGFNRCLRHINIGRNFAGIKNRNLPQVLDTIVLLIQDEHSPIESLSLADSKLKSETTNLINALGANSSLREIDISGNLMGDIGARMLAKALQLNTKLHTVHWDNNGTTPQGLTDIANALETNYTLKQMPTPINDATQAFKISADKTGKALQRIEKFLQRNHSPRKFSAEQAYRLQQGFLLSSSQQMVDKLIIQMEALLATRAAGTMASSEQDAVRSLLRDAERTRQVLPAFHKLLMQQDDDTRLRGTLNKMADDLQNSVQQQMTKNVNSMLLCANSQCPTVMKEKTFQQEMSQTCREKSAIPANFTQGLLVEQAGTDIGNKISEINLAVAAYVSDRITEGVLDSLDKSYKKLSNKLSGESELDREARKSILRTKSNESLEDSPKLSKKRKSIYSRRLRPQSTINAQEVHEAALKLRLKEVDEVPESPPSVHRNSKPPPLMHPSPRLQRKIAPPVPSEGEPARSVTSQPPASTAATTAAAEKSVKGEESKEKTGSSDSLASATAAATSSSTTTQVKSATATPEGSPKKSAPPPPPTSGGPIAAPRKKRQSNLTGSTTSLAEDGDGKRNTWVVVNKKEKGEKRTPHTYNASVKSSMMDDGAQDGDIMAEVDDQSDNRSEDSLDTTDLTDLTDTASTVDSLLDSRESTPSSDVTRPNRLASGSGSISDLDVVAPLESSGVPKLQHLGKNRPKRTKTRAASRAIIQSDAEVIEDTSSSGMDVDEFFDNNKVRTTITPSSSIKELNGAPTKEEESKQEAKKKVSPKGPTTPTTDKVGFAAGFTKGLGSLFGKSKSPSPKSPEPPVAKTPEEPPKRSPVLEEEPEPQTKDTPDPELASPSGTRLPPGARGMPGMGGGLPGMGGGNFMSELRKKQRESVMPKSTPDREEDKTDEPAPPLPRQAPPAPTPIVAAPTKAAPNYGGQRPPSLLPRNQRDSTVPVPPAATTTQDTLAVNKPVAAARRSVSPNDVGEKQKPPPPLKPRPNLRPRPRPGATPTATPPSAAPTSAPRLTKPNPAPAARTSAPPSVAAASPPVRQFSVRAYLRRFQDPEDEGNESGESRESSPGSGGGGGSRAIKKRGSVRERARFLDGNSNVSKAGNGGGSPAAAPSTGAATTDSILRTRTLPHADRTGSSDSMRSRSMIADSTDHARLETLLSSSLPLGGGGRPKAGEENSGGKENSESNIVYL